MMMMVDDMHSDMQNVGVSYGTRQSQINRTRIIWQTDTDEPLQCPANCKWCGSGAGYQPFAEILPKFQAADALPADWWGQWYVQRCLRTITIGTNHADCFSIPANSKTGRGSGLFDAISTPSLRDMKIQQNAYYGTNNVWNLTFSSLRLSICVYLTFSRPSTVKISNF